MDIHIISKGVLFYIVYALGTVLFLMHYKFEISTQVFTLLLLIGVLFISIYIGYKRKTLAEVHGFFVGVCSAGMLLFFLKQFLELNWEINFLMMVMWSFIGFIGSAIGSKLTRKKANV